MSKQRCQYDVFDNRTRRLRKCKKKTNELYCTQHQILTNASNFGTCCFCGEGCNPCSQSCGRCARQLIWCSTLDEFDRT